MSDEFDPFEMRPKSVKLPNSHQMKEARELDHYFLERHLEAGQDRNWFIKSLTWNNRQTAHLLKEQRKLIGLAATIILGIAAELISTWLGHAFWR